MIRARQSELRLKVMGTSAHIAVRGGTSQLVPAMADRLSQLECRWSRFLPNSEISQLNRAMGEPMLVSRDTLRLLSVAVEGWRRTEGAFDPTVYDALVGLGYDRTFDEVRPILSPARQLPAPGCGQIEIDSEKSVVRLPLGVRFDPGGIGKGLAADFAVNEVMAAGVDGVFVNVGGDIRTAGAGPHQGWWSVDIEEPATPPTRVVVGDAAIVSSTTRKRRWTVGSSAAHHLVDPATGASMQSPWTFVTAIAGNAWWAEVATKALMLNGPGAVPRAVAARLVADDGSEVTIGDFERFIR